MNTVSDPAGISLETTVCASSQQVCCAIADEVVLLSMRDGEYYGLNDVAATIWNLILQPVTVRQIKDALLEEFGDVGAAECERALFQFLRELISLNLVVLACDPNSAERPTVVTLPQLAAE